MTIEELIREAHETAVAKGWHDPSPRPGEVIALIHSELSEALEELRSGRPLDMITAHPRRDCKPEGYLVELADVLIRLADHIGYLGLGAEFEAAVKLKLAFNRMRPHRHGGRIL